MQVIAHRGSGPHGPEPENTLSAFDAARRLGADGVELDVRRSGDGSLVVVHDAALRDGRLVCDVPRHALPSDIPSLEEAIEACAGLFLNLEVKNLPSDPDFDPSEDVARRSAVVLSRTGGTLAGSVLSSFSRAALAAVGDVAPALERALLSAFGSNLVEEAVADGLGGIHPHDALVTGDLVARARAAHLAVRAWTVDDPGRVSHLGDLGLDAVITNEVAAARAALARPSAG